MTDPLLRWVRAASGLVHLDLGERLAQSPRRQSAGQTIVTACKAHLNASTAVLAGDDSRPRCSHCQLIARLHMRPVR